MRGIVGALLAVGRTVAQASAATAVRPAGDGPIAAGADRAFAHQQTTRASPDAVWAAWMDVPGWKQWDLGLKDARADGPLRLGATGVVVPRSGPEAPFRVTEFEPRRSYAFETRLPLATLRVRRLILGSEPTTFRHEVSFHGLAAPFWAWQAGGQFRRALPPTMTRLAAEAEARP